MRIYRLNDESYHLASAWADLGSSYEILGENVKAKDCFRDALNILRSTDGILYADVLRNAASIFYKLKDFKFAARNLEKAIALLRQIDGPHAKSLGESLYWFGCTLYHLGDLDASQRSLRAGLRLFMKENGDHRKMVILTKLAQGRNHMRRLEVDEAASCANEATDKIKESQKALSTEEHLEVLFLSGELSKDLKNYESAIQTTEKAWRIIERAKKTHYYARTSEVRRLLVTLYCEVGEYSMARRHASNYLNELVERNDADDSEIILIRELCGDVARESGAMGAAISHYEKVLSLQDELPFTIDSCELVLNIAKCSAASQNWQKALGYLSRADTIANLVHESENVQFRVQLEKASVLFSQGKKEESMAIYSDIFCSFEQNDDGISIESHLNLAPMELVKMYTNIGVCMFDEKEQAVQYLTKAAEICSSDRLEEKALSRDVISRLAEAHKLLIERCGKQHSPAGDDIHLASLQINLGNLFIRAQEYESAILIFQHLLGLQRNTDNRLQLATTLHNLGSCYLELGDINSATPILEEALKIGKAMLGHDHVDVADTSYTLARAYEISSNIDESVSLLQATIKIRMDTYGMESFPMLYTLHTMGAVLTAGDRTERAIKVYQDALRIQNRLPQQNNRLLCSTTHFLIAQAYIANESLELGLSHLKAYINSPYKRSCGLQVNVATALYEIGSFQIKSKQSISFQFSAF